MKAFLRDIERFAMPFFDALRSVEQIADLDEARHLRRLAPAGGVHRCARGGDPRRRDRLIDESDDDDQDREGTVEAQDAEAEGSEASGLSTARA